MCLYINMCICVCIPLKEWIHTFITFYKASVSPKMIKTYRCREFCLGWAYFTTSNIFHYILYIILYIIYNIVYFWLLIIWHEVWIINGWWQQMTVFQRDLATIESEIVKHIWWMMWKKHRTYRYLVWCTLLWEAS